MTPEWMKFINAVTSVAVIVAVVVTIHDISRRAPRAMAGTCTKAAYRVLLGVFLTAVGFGEGSRVFNWMFAHGPGPDVIETATGVAWGMLSGWLVVVRPFARLEILCPFASRCSAVRAEREGREPDLIELGTRSAREYTNCHGSP
jgi:hypothetical protein